MKRVFVFAGIALLLAGVTFADGRAGTGAANGDRDGAAGAPEVTGPGVPAAETQAQLIPIEDYDYLRDPSALREYLTNPLEPFYLVDVRAPDEYASGHIPSSIQIDYRQIGTTPPTDDKDAFIIVYCRSGGRSSQAAATLQAMGYTRVLNWGGIGNWPYDVVTGGEPE